MIPNKTNFYSEDLSTPRPTPKLEDHPLSAVSDCMFSIFAATLHTGSRSSIRNLKMRHAVVTGTHLSPLTAVITAHYAFDVENYSYGEYKQKNKSPAKLSWLQTQPLISL